MPSNGKELDKILDCIVSQEAITEGGWAEYTTDPEAIKYGNPLHNKDELKQAIESLIQKEVVEARVETLKITHGHQQTGTELDDEYFVHNVTMLERQLNALNQANKEKP